MARYIFVVLTDAVPGEDAAFNDWYDNRHVADVLKVDGYVSAQRFRFVDRQGGHPAPLRYLALYEVEADDIDATHQRLAAVAGSSEMPWHPAFDRSTVIGWYFEPIGEKRIRTGAESVRP